MRRRWLLVIICGWTAIFLNTLLNAEDGVFPRRDLTRVDYQAEQQENIHIFPTLGALAGESYEAHLALLLSGIHNTRSSFILRGASRATCRQALCFALGVWWVESSALTTERSILLTNQPTLTSDKVSARSVNSTLINVADAEKILEQALAPWLSGAAGMSYLPADGMWSATLDDNGHQRFMELLTELERPRMRASTWVSDANDVDVRQFMQHPIDAHNWLDFMQQLANSTDCSVALAPEIMLKTFPEKRIQSDVMRVHDLLSHLSQLGIYAAIAHGVIGITDAPLSTMHNEREHPAQRRHIAVLPIRHLIERHDDAETIMLGLRENILPGWTTLPGWGLWYLKNEQALLVAADIPTQHAIMDALHVIDRFGLRSGLSRLTETGAP